MLIKVYKHSSLRTNIDDDLLKVPLYFSSDFVKQYINEEVVLDIETTSKDYKDDTLFKPNEEAYDTVMFIYEQGAFPVYGTTHPYSDKLRVCYISVNPLEDKIDYHWKKIAHEILHSLVFKIMSENKVFIPNLLDYSKPINYYKNDNPFASDGNFSQQLEVLKPFYMKIVTITRQPSTAKETIGELRTFDGKFGCYTLELAWKNNQKNISSIPKGMYKVKWTFSPKFMKYTYEILDVPNRTGIRFHTANYWFSLQGCIALGALPKDLNNDKEIDLQNSKLITTAFENYMGKKPFLLVIK